MYNKIASNSIPSSSDTRSVSIEFLLSLNVCFICEKLIRYKHYYLHGTECRKQIHFSKIGKWVGNANTFNEKQVKSGERMKKMTAIS